MSLAGWSLIIAIAGVGLAALTFVTNRQAIRNEQADRKKAIEDAWAFEWAAQRPVLYPVLSRIMAKQVLPIKNGGRGPALNVVAELEYHNDKGEADGHWVVSFGPVAAGDVEEAAIGPRLSPPWRGISGVLRYGDLAGGRYETPFRFSQGRGGLKLFVDEQKHITAAEVQSEGSDDGASSRA